VRRVARVMPAFLLLSLGGCILGRYIFKVPLNQLGVVVAVPTLGLFAISRVLALALPDTPNGAPRPSSHLPGALPILGAAFLAGIAAIDFLLSAGIFARLGVYGAAPHFYTLAETFAVISAASLALSSALLMQDVMAELAEMLTRGIWRLLLLPTQLVALLANSHKPHHSRQ